ncbi:MAG: hypothetical protein ACKV2V_11115 [Blastocatellia bacterium]
MSDNITIPSPVWEQMLTEIREARAENRAAFAQIDARMDAMERRMDAMEKEMRQLRHRFDNQALDLTHVRGDIRDLNLRVETLEAA